MPLQQEYGNVRVDPSTPNRLKHTHVHHHNSILRLAHQYTTLLQHPCGACTYKLGTLALITTTQYVQKLYYSASIPRGVGHLICWDAHGTTLHCISCLTLVLVIQLNLLLGGKSCFVVCCIVLHHGHNVIFVQKCTSITSPVVACPWQIHPLALFPTSMPNTLHC